MQCSSAGKVLAYYTQSIGFDPMHRTDQAWWYKPVTSTLGCGGRKSKGSKSSSVSYRKF